MPTGGLGKVGFVGRGGGGDREEEITTCPKGIPLTEKTGLAPLHNMFWAKWNTISFLNATNNALEKSCCFLGRTEALLNIFNAFDDI